MFEWMKPRDPARIDEIVDLLREAWKRHPDWRLCQLVSNCAYSSLDKEQRARVIAENEARGGGRGFDPFYVEDTDMKPQIEKLAKGLGLSQSS
jgi:hypothetical protein